MPETLLRTKLFVPPPRSNLVSRPRLIERLKQGPKRGQKLTLVAAPAGYGKTTLVAEGLPHSAWLALDEGDNDPARFWTYAFAALKTVWADLDDAAVKALGSPQPPPIEVLLRNLINQVITLTDRVILVLDDYHVVENQEIHEDITFLLDHLPPQLHLVIVSRSDPPLNLARMRGRGRLTELRETDLRFTAEETKAFFLQTADLQLSADSIAALHRRTEGWVVGLQLAGLALQGRENVSDFVQAFTGDHSYVIDYLTEEVFQRQSPTVQTFLLESSILNRLSGPLCDATLGGHADQRRNGQAMLAYLNQQNLFLIPLDDRRLWYRYHHFFADILRYRLQQTCPARIPELHQRASTWFSENGFVPDALHHALAAGDFDQAADLIESVTRPMIGGGEATTVQAWIESLPESLLQKRPLLCVSLAWVYNLNQVYRDIEPLLQNAENALQLGTFNRDIVADVRGNIAILRGYSALQQNNPPLALQHMEASLAILPEGDVYLRSLVSFTQGVIYKRGGLWHPAAEKLKQATDYGRVSDNLTVAIGNRVHLIEMLITQGQLRQAAHYCEETIAHHLADRPRNPVPYLGFVYTKLGEILYEWNDLDAAHHNLEHGLALADQLLVAWSWTRDGLVYLARLRQIQHDYEAAQEFVERAVEMSGEMQDQFDRIDISYWQARLWLAQSKLVAAVRWAQEYQINIAAHTEAADVVLARVLLAQGQMRQALGILTSVTEAAGTTGRVYTQIETLALQALAYQAQSNSSQARRTVAHALSLAEPEDFNRLFIDEGPPMAALLRQLLRHPEDTIGGEFLFTQEYISRLLAAFPEGETAPSSAVAASGALKEREIQVLRLIAAGLKTPEIAEQLHLSNNTIKWYCRELYSKLAVHSRAEAIAEGYKLGVLN